MDLKDSRESSNVEDVRGQGRGPGPGGDPFGRRGVNIPIGNMRGGSIGSIVLIIIVVIVLQFMGVDVGSLLGDGSYAGGPDGAPAPDSRWDYDLRPTEQGRCRRANCGAA